ncbi:MAG TPA: ABC transporter permease [Salinivirgaceae bacterium]|nr:ABC transporter permease [Salinivirgaceae bacterium]
MNFFYLAGLYFVFLKRVFSKPEKQKFYLKNIFTELWNLGISSIGIVAIISFFIGAVITLQTAYNVTSPLFPLYLIGLGTRDSMILEFSSTIVSLILAGKIGSSIAGEIGTMRVTEQIDALETMGVNPASFLVMPKIVAMLVMSPVLNIFSVFIGILGGYITVWATSVIPLNDFLYGVTTEFIPFYVTYSLVKSTVFGFIITSVSAFQGFYVKGGSLEVGRAGTRSVVYSSILILIFNLILTQLLLA